jgi:Skp family chaperone for outer membrane proteins
MSTAAVSSASIFQEIQSFYQTRQADVKQLGSALQSGDLNGAQQAYSALAALGQSGPFANSEPFSKSAPAQAFEAIGQDLQAGDLAGAQAAFATLSKQNDSAAPAQATPAAVVNLTPPVNTTATGDASSIYQQLQAYREQRQTELAQLGQDLQAGNARAAQQDFNTLTALGQSGPNANGQTFARTDRNQDFQAIGQALQSGDLAGAQSAFTALAGTFGGQSQQAQAATAAYTSNAVEIVINLGGSTSTGAAAGSTTPELVINLDKGSSASSPNSSVPEVVINLGDSPNTGAATESTAPEITINIG